MQDFEADIGVHAANAGMPNEWWVPSVSYNTSVNLLSSYMLRCPLPIRSSEALGPNPTHVKLQPQSPERWTSQSKILKRPVLRA